jgi:N-acyl-D-amino-acid deacylase
VFSGGNDSVMMRLKNTEQRKKIKKEMVDLLKKKQLKNYQYALVAHYGADTTVNGKRITEINRLKGRKPKAIEEAETILEMVERRVVLRWFTSVWMKKTSGVLCNIPSTCLLLMRV